MRRVQSWRPSHSTLFFRNWCHGLLNNREMLRWMPREAATGVEQVHSPATARVECIASHRRVCHWSLGMMFLRYVRERTETLPHFLFHHVSVILANPQWPASRSLRDG
jgi:hypothetical protein